MKIVCLGCNRIIGEMEPLGDMSQVKAKCTECVANMAETMPRYGPSANPKDGQEIVLANGMKGILWVDKATGERLCFGEILIEGKKFFCNRNEREIFHKYLESMATEQCNVSFLHSIARTIDSGSRKRKKMQCQTVEAKDTSIQYNCTVKVDKRTILSMYDRMSERMKKVAEIYSRAMIHQQKSVNINKTDNVPIEFDGQS